MTAPKAKNGKTVKQNVLDILGTFPETRNNDRLLFAYYWGAVDDIDFENGFGGFIDSFATATPPSGIQRVRQMINYDDIADENYLPTDPAILAYRKKMAQDLRVEHAKRKQMQLDLQLFEGENNNG